MKRMILLAVLLATACTATPYWNETPLPVVSTVTPLPVVFTDTPAPAPTIATLRKSPVEYTAVGNANLRKCPDVSCAVIGYVNTGDVVGVILCTDDWCAVNTGGYVYAPCLGFEGVCK